MKEDDGFRGPAEKFLDDKDRDEAQANGPDDEDMADEQFEGEKVAPQVQKVPDLAANDIELQQQKRFRVSVFANKFAARCSHLHHEDQIISQIYP